MKVDGSLKSLLQGVSQQPPRDRLAGQCTEQINMTADPVSGLARRAPTDLVGALGASADVRGFYNFQTRDGKKFLAFFRNGSVRITDYNAVEVPVTIDSDAGAYISSAGKLAFGTIENQVVIANRGVTPAMTNDLKFFANKGTSSYPMGIVQVLGGQYAREYRITMDGTLIAMYKPPNGSEAPMVDYVRTTLIAQRLYEGMTGIPTSGVPDGAGSYIIVTGALATGYTVTRYEDCILIRKNTAGSAEFTLTASDDAGNTNVKVMTDTVPDTADLPRIAPHRYLARVATETDPEEDLFLQFIVNEYDTTDSEAGIPADTDDAHVGDGFGLSGYWQECVSSDVKYEVDPATFPHILEYSPSTYTFHLRRGKWKNRRVGTGTSNPNPSFIGNPVTDVTTFQGRLVFLSGSYACMSRTNRYEDFWMGSASQLVDTDPIDVSSTAVQASTMLAAIPNNRDLVIFSQRGQFIVFGRSALTPANATLVLTTTFEAELNAKPVAAGRNVFFATNYGRYTGIREFYTEGSTDINDARPITQHINKYLVGTVAHMIASSNYSMLLVQTDKELNTIYIYQYLWNDTTKLQSAWSKWVFPNDVKYMFFDQETIYYVGEEVTSDGTEHFLHRMSLDIVSEVSVGYPLYLDSRFDAADVHTSFVLPYNRLHTASLVVVQGADCPNPGLTVPIKSIVYNSTENYYVVTLRYDMNGGSVICGIPYYSEYRPTNPLIKDKDGIVIASSKLRIKQFIVNTNSTGHIIGQLQSKYGDGEPVEFQGRIVGAPENIVGEVALTDDKFYMPFREMSDRADMKFHTNRHLPMTLLAIEWSGQYWKSGQRVSNGDK